MREKVGLKNMELKAYLWKDDKFWVECGMLHKESKLF